MASKASYDLTSVKDAETCGIRYIGIGTCSSGKMREYLRKKGFSGSIINEAVDNLIRREYIDDERAGRKVLLNRSGRKQESKSYLRQRLYAAGVSSAVADVLISEVADDVDLCFNLYLSIAPAADPESEDPSFMNELLKTAAKRGFNPDVARLACRKYLEKVINDKQK